MKNRKTKPEKRQTLRLVLLVLAGSLLLILPQSAAGQYTNSFSRIMDMTRTWNQNLWDAQKNLQAVEDRGAKLGATSSGASRGQPMVPMRQYPITVTDFRPVAVRLLPAELANNTPGLTREQRDELRGLYDQFLTAFEKDARKNNVANAFAFAVGVSLEVVSGKELSDADANVLIQNFNSVLGNVPQFNALGPEQKQALYELSVITGGMIGFLHLKGVEAKDAGMQTQARELARMVLKHFLGLDVR